MQQRRTVRPGISHDLRELNAALATANSRVDDLDAGSPSEGFDEAADELFRVYNLARNLGSRESFTGCPLHPDGAVDPLAPMGWGKCLLCNERRKKGGASVPTADQITAPWQTSDRRRKIPDSATGLQELRSVMRTVNDLAFRLNVESPPGDFERIAGRTYTAFCIARELSRPIPRTGCSIHPQGPVDRNPPTGWGDCQLCNTIRWGREKASAPGWRERLPTDSMRRPMLRPHDQPSIRRPSDRRR
ncbi:hypothetical protein [Actinoallomurus sp. NPDC052274]|uniref:hypothetical protein n=1 Tax=Actinoallomurus sp. NPDC052274 TaxID=3155420 RepID=UPI0034319613